MITKEKDGCGNDVLRLTLDFGSYIDIRYLKASLFEVMDICTRSCDRRASYLALNTIINFLGTLTSDMEYFQKSKQNVNVDEMKEGGEAHG